MTYNVKLYSMEDRDKDGQRDDAKPEEERKALVEVIASVHPDILAIQEMGVAEDFARFREDLSRAGLAYPHYEHLEQGGKAAYRTHMAVLSRFPFASVQSHTNETYTIGEHKDIPVARGFIDLTIQVKKDLAIRLMTAHLKSKLFNELGQTEMRRNEGRLLGKLVRQALAEDPAQNLLVVGDLNDYPRSRAVREVTGVKKKLLTDLRPVDEVGDSWTYCRSYRDEYSRIDYILASDALRAKVVPSKTRAIRHPGVAIASDHRPVVVVFDAGK